MNEYLIQGELMTAFANEVRRLNGTSNTYNAAQIVDILQRIQNYTVSESSSEGQLVINNNSVEYFIQDDLMNSMAKEIRRISNTTNTYNALQMAEFLPRIQGSVGEVDGAHWVRVVNHAGEVLESQYLDEGMIYALPTDIGKFSNLVPDGYAFRDWNSNIALKDGYLVVPDHDVKIFPTYDTQSGASEFVVTPNVTSVYLPSCYSANGDVYVDWGDGNVTDASAYATREHVYSTTGDYVVKVYNATKIAYAVGNDNFTSVRLSYTVTEIGSNAFADYTMLANVVIPNSVVSIGECAFHSCVSLKDMFVPNGVISIGNFAFYGCTNLHSIRIPASVTTIGDDAFSYGFSNVKKVDIEDIGSYLNINSGNGWDSPMYGYSTYDNSPSSSIELFIDGKSVRQIVIPSGNTTIPKGCFANCSNICSVIMSDTTTSIQGYAFGHCNGLTSITLGNSLETIGTRAFYACACLTSVTIPSSVTSIESGAFFGTHVYHVINHSTVTLSTGASNTNMFDGNLCVAVDSNGNKTYYSTSLGNCELIDTDDGFRFVKVDEDTYQLISYIGLDTSITLPSDINGKGYMVRAFVGGINIIVPYSTFITLDEYAFSSTIIKSIVFSDGITTLPRQTCYIAPLLSSLTAPTVTIINAMSFRECRSLIEVVLPKVSYLGHQVFQNCKNLTTVVLSYNGVCNMGWYGTEGNSIPFENCEKLESIYVPDTLVNSYKSNTSWSPYANLIKPLSEYTSSTSTT